MTAACPRWGHRLQAGRRPRGLDRQAALPARGRPNRLRQAAHPHAYRRRRRHDPVVDPQAVPGFRAAAAASVGDRRKLRPRRKRVHPVRPARRRYRRAMAARGGRFAEALGPVRQLRDAALSAHRAEGIFRPLSTRRDVDTSKAPRVIEAPFFCKKNSTFLSVMFFYF